MSARYARNGDVSLAYDVIGGGERDVLVTLGWVASFQSIHENDAHSRWIERLARLGRVILWDKRGTGLSDRVSSETLPTLEERMDDMRAVMEAAGSRSAVLVGLSEGGSLSALFAATYPALTDALVIVGGFPRVLADEGYPGRSEEEAVRFEHMVTERWGDNAWLLKLWAPSLVGDKAAEAAWNRWMVNGASPATARAWLAMARQTDVREVLPAIRVPTLVVHRSGDRIVPVEQGRSYADDIQGARWAELPGRDHLWWVDGDDILDEIESFLTGAPAQRDPDRVLATVLFTDIVDSTRCAAELGDRRWRHLIGEHDRLVRRYLGRFRGREVKTLGDGFLATFDGPGRAIRCASAIQEGVRELGLVLRAGLHTGECEVLGDDIGGLAVNIGARVGAKAGPGEVLVSQTVKDLVAGSGFGFEERGEHELKGVPGAWRLYAVGSAPL
jgi:class 3 adenylate cyclase